MNSLKRNSRDTMNFGTLTGMQMFSMFMMLATFLLALGIVLLIGSTKPELKSEHIRSQNFPLPAPWN